MQGMYVRGLLLVPFLLFCFAPQQVLAAPTCGDVSFAKSVQPGGSVSYTVPLTNLSEGFSFVPHFGAMPFAVNSTDLVEFTTRDFTVDIKTRGTALPGSYTLPIFVSLIDPSGEVVDTISCSFTLVIEVDATALALSISGILELFDGGIGNRELSTAKLSAVALLPYEQTASESQNQSFYLFVGLVNLSLVLMLGSLIRGPPPRAVSARDFIYSSQAPPRGSPFYLWLHRYFKNAYAFFFVVVLLFTLPNAVHAAETATTSIVGATSHRCIVVPFSQVAIQGQQANYSVELYPSATSSSFEIRTGSLPYEVNRGFLPLTSSSTPEHVSLLFTTNERSQVGPLTLSILYLESDGVVLQETKCLFELVIMKASTTRASLTAATITPIVPVAVPPADTATSSEEVGVETVPFLSTIDPTLKNQLLSRESQNLDSLAESNGAKDPVFIKWLGYRERGVTVSILQDVLRMLGYFPQGQASTGYFGKLTESGVRALQKAHGLESVGYLGPKTRALLNELRP